MATSTSSASLIIKVDATETNKGAEALDNLTISAGKAETAATSLASASKAGGDAVSDVAKAASAATEQVKALYSPQIIQSARSLQEEQQEIILGLLGYGTAAERAAAMAVKQAAAQSASIQAVIQAEAKVAVATSAATGAIAENTAAMTINGGVARELGVLTGEGLRGNFTRMEGSAITLANRLGLMNTVFSPLGLAIGGAAAAIGIMSAAAIQGYLEEQELNRAIVATGQYSGVTAGRVHDMAVEIGGTEGDIGKATNALQQLIDSGQVVSYRLKDAAQGSVDYATVTGKSIDQASAAFIRMQGDPLGVVKEMDKQLHFLTLTEYENIRALQERGDTETASAIAQKLASDAVRDRAAEVKENLGYLEAAWKSVATQAKTAWDQMANTGRTKSNSDDFNDASNELKRLRDQMHVSNNDELLNASMSSFAQGQIQALLAKQASAKAGMQFEGWIVDGAAQGQKEAAAAKEVDDEWNTRRKSADKHYALAIETAKIEEQARKLIAGGADPTEIAEQKQQQIAAAEKRYADKKPKAAKADPFASLNGLVQKAAMFDQSIGQDKPQNEQAAKIIEIVDAGAKLIASGKDVATVQADVAKGVAYLNDGYAKQADIVKAQSVVALADYQAALDAQVAAQKRAIDAQVAKIGMGDKEYERQQQLNDITIKGNDAITKLTESRNKLITTNPGADTTVIDGEIAKQTVMMETLKTNAMQGFKEIDAASADWTNGMTHALKNYLDQASDVAGQSATLFTNAFNGMSDSLANFATTGKLNFKGLVTSILGDLAKMEMKIAMSKILQQVLGAFMSGSGSGGFSNSDAMAGSNIGSGSSGYGMMLQNAMGGVYSSPSLSAYSGQVVNTPTAFKFASGAGIMGEAGPEAIMPLSRGSDGKLGVKMQGSGGDVVTNISIQVDSSGSAKSSTNTDNSDAMARALAAQMKQAATDVVVRATQPGGILFNKGVR